MEKDEKILSNHRYPGYAGSIGLRLFLGGKYDRSGHHYKRSRFNKLINPHTNDNFFCSHRANARCGVINSGSN
jgi:hypothetical protein